MMLRLIFYDIESDKYRTKLANKLEAAGFVRLQFSVFSGKHTLAQWQKIWLVINKLHDKYGQPNDKIQVLLMSQNNFKNMQAIGEKPNFELILDEIITMWIK